MTKLNRPLPEVPAENGRAPLWARLFLGGIGLCLLLIAIVLALFRVPLILTGAIFLGAVFFGWAACSARKNIAFEIIQGIIEFFLYAIAGVLRIFH
ncbi:hypothetical protein QQ056_13900 [Oscillatoria laete-virens NRMC-F 0139]|nr:hypothetical protein [Oscillatoria laete-virens]MDL5054631.1 hypothetical protein [Oscillatoria laete-virens NRMC-F 0139]